MRADAEAFGWKIFTESFDSVLSALSCPSCGVFWPVTDSSAVAVGGGCEFSINY